MFEILRKSFRTGVVTPPYPPPAFAEPPPGRGRPEIPFATWKDARLAASACPTGAIQAIDSAGVRHVVVDLAKCTFCGLCAEADPAIRMTTDSSLSCFARGELKTTVSYELNAEGKQNRVRLGPSHPPASSPGSGADSIGAMAERVRERAHAMFGRSLHIRQVDAGSCNGCEIEIGGLNSPVYDLERFGMHFVASPRHADMLLVTGPVSRNMELALRKTYEATPEPRLVVAVGACGCSGGIFGVNYATRGAVDQVIPVDVYIPGCPPSPLALLQGIFLAVTKPHAARRA